MDEFGQKPTGHADLQLDLYQSKNDWRSYSMNSYPNHQQNQNPNPNPSGLYNGFDAQFPYDFDRNLKRAKTMSGSSSLAKVWCFSDPEFKRKKRVASYRALTVEGKVKGSFRKSFKWIKDRFLYGWL